MDTKIYVLFFQGLLGHLRMYSRHFKRIRSMISRQRQILRIIVFVFSIAFLIVGVTLYKISETDIILFLLIAATNIVSLW